MGHGTWVVAGFVWLSGCTLVSGVDDYRVDEGSDSGASAEDRDLRVTVADMHPHGSQNVDFVAYDTDTRLITARALVRMPPVPEDIDDYPDVSFTMPSAVPGGSEHTLSFFADVNDNGVADAIGTDHTWTESISTQGEVDFLHNTMFDDLTDLGLQPLGADVIIRLERGRIDLPGLISGQSRVLEVRLSFAGTDRVVGLLQIHPDPETELPDAFRLVGIADSGNTYDVRAFADGQLIEGSEQTVKVPREGDLEITVRASQLDL